MSQLCHYVPLALQLNRYARDLMRFLRQIRKNAAHACLLLNQSKNVEDKWQNECLRKKTYKELCGKKSPRGQLYSAVKKQPRFLHIPSGLRGHVWGGTTYSLTLLLNTAVMIKHWTYSLDWISGLIYGLCIFMTCPCIDQ